jgi:superfamily II DNA or RNA helicase
MSVPKMMQYLESAAPEFSKRLRSLYLKRVEIVKKAHNKSDAFRQIIGNQQLRRCLVYCNDLDHLGENIKIAYDEGLEPLEFSSRIKPNERKRILNAFETNTGNILLIAVRCLDEGVDIPACDTAILISCSRSMREFIQRRGRVLRKHPKKGFSTIYDIVVLPFASEKDAYPITPSEFNFIKEELRRVGVLSSNAINSKDFNVDEQIELYRKYMFV